MMTGGETIECDTNPPPTLMVRLRRLRWWTYGLVKYRMMECTGYLKWKHRYMKGPIPEGQPERRLRRPPHWIRTPWFKVRGIYGNVIHRLKLLTGWYEVNAKIAFAIMQQNATPKNVSMFQVYVNGKPQVWQVSKRVLDKLASALINEK